MRDIGSEAVKSSEAIDVAIGEPASQEDDFAVQMSALVDAIARRVVHTITESGNPNPNTSILSAASIAATGIINRASELMRKRTMQ